MEKVQYLLAAGVLWSRVTDTGPWAPTHRVCSPGSYMRVMLVILGCGVGPAADLGCP
jgi:hypothetical protein